jgi:hypothetical protein
MIISLPSSVEDEVVVLFRLRINSENESTGQGALHKEWAHRMADAYTGHQNTSQKNKVMHTCQERVMFIYKSRVEKSAK